jgi:hypothetical protein
LGPGEADSYPIHVNMFNDDISIYYPFFLYFFMDTEQEEDDQLSIGEVSPSALRDQA